jgi:exodeoxyribonuclease-3
MQKGLQDWIAENSFDMICFQETKMDSSHADPDYFKSLGYHSIWHCAEKKGYSGVLILSKEKPSGVSYGTGNSNYDREGRLIVADFPGFSLANCYFPSGTSGEERHNFKMQFLKDIQPVFNKLLQEKKNLIVVGDYNIVHKELGYRPEERAWLDSWFKDMFDDSFRIIHPDKKEFSWWSYRAGSYQKDKGWRIDYHSVSKSLSSKVKDFKHHKTPRFSDHCALEASYEI